MDFLTPDTGGVLEGNEPERLGSASNGKVIATYSLALKGAALTAVMKATKPEGGLWSRRPPEPRLWWTGPGQVKSTEVKGAATTWNHSSANGITVKYPEFQVACKASLDGKDYPQTGAGANMKQTLAFEKSGANAIKMTTKLNGKLFYVDVLTLSADGKTLTDEGNPVAVKEPVKAVYEKQ